MKHRVVFSLLLALYVGLNAGLIPAQAQPLQNAACPQAAPARLAVGAKAQVIAPSSKALTYPTAFLKPDITHASSVLRYLPIGTVVDVTGAAQCGDDGNRWWKVKLGDLSGYIAEAIGKDYVLGPAQNGDSGAASLPTTTMVALVCIAPRTTTNTIQSAAAATPGQTPDVTATPSEVATVAATLSSKITPTVTPTLTLTPTPEVSPTATLDPSKSISRVAYATSDGAVYISDNGGAGRTLNRFDPPPLSVDLSPDGTAVLVANYNGLYWIDAANGNTVLLDDPLKFGLAEEAWIDRVSWLPDGLRAAVETTKIDTGTLVFSLWEAPLDGTAFPYEVDTGAQFASQFVSGIQRSPSGLKSVLLSTNNIGRWPATATEDTFDLLRFVPEMTEGDVGIPTTPTLSWDSADHGFYTFIPVSDQAPPDDPVGGHLWYVPMVGNPVDQGVPPKLIPLDYVIASNDGKYILAGHGSGAKGTWSIRDAKTGEVVKALPPLDILFGWTADYKGVVYRTPTGDAAYLGIDGSTSSPFVPSASNLYKITWMTDGTILFVALGKDKKLSFSIQLPGKDPVFLGIIPTLDTFNGRALPDAPGAANTPTQCK